MQAICDAAKCAGSTNDSFVFSVSPYYDDLKREKLPQDYWVAADESYVYDERIITLIPRSDAELDMLLYNYCIDALDGTMEGIVSESATL